MFASVNRRSIVVGVLCFAIAWIPWLMIRSAGGETRSPLITGISALCLGVAAFVLQHALDRIRPEVEAEIKAFIRLDETGNPLDNLEYEQRVRHRRRRLWARYGIAVVLFALAIVFPLVFGR
jgi:hypothetical protein